MIKLRSSLNPVWWSVEDDDSVKFKLKPLTSPEIESIQPIGREFSARDYQSVIKLGVIDVDGLDSLDALDRLDLITRAEIVAEVLRISTVQDDDVKN